MVVEGLIGALGGALISGLLVGGFNYLNTSQKIEAENQRLQAEIYAEKKAETLAQLHSRFVDCRQIMNKQLGIRADDLTEEEVQTQIISRVDSLQATVDRATIFLEDEQMEAITDAYLTISGASGYLEAESRGEPHSVSKTDSGTLIKNTEAAMEVLKEEINGPIEQFESS